MLEHWLRYCLDITGGRPVPTENLNMLVVRTLEELMATTHCKWQRHIKFQERKVSRAVGLTPPAMGLRSCSKLIAKIPCIPVMPLNSQVSKFDVSLLGTRFHIEKISIDCMASKESGDTSIDLLRRLLTCWYNSWWIWDP